MPCLQLKDGACSSYISTRGGAIWSFDFEHQGRIVPILVARGDRTLDAAGEAGCFPLVPFGNRIRDNHFTFEGRDYSLLPNTPADPLCLHGDGWLSEWDIAEQTQRSLGLELKHSATDRSPYDYRAKQEIEIRDNRLCLTLSVTNTGPTALLFGIGWHPFFSLTPSTLLKAQASAFWREGAGHLPTGLEALPMDLDFNRPATIPERWINNGFEGSDGHARIEWPEWRAAVDIEASPIFSRYVLYRPDRNRDPDHAGRFICFEPMSHAIDAHHLSNGGGLRRLAPNETLSGSLTLMPIPVDQ